VKGKKDMNGVLIVTLVFLLVWTGATGFFARRFLLNRFEDLDDSLTAEVHEAAKGVKETMHAAHNATRDALRPPTVPEVWGVWARYQIIEEDYTSFENKVDATQVGKPVFEKPATKKLVDMPLGNYEVRDAIEGVNTLDVQLMPQMAGRIKEVRAYGGPWVIDDVIVGKYSQKASSGPLCDPTLSVFLNATVQVGQLVTVRLVRAGSDVRRRYR
jgi:hypothetical protein